MNSKNLATLLSILVVVPCQSGAEDIAVRERDFSDYEEHCEYSTDSPSESILRRAYWVDKTGVSQILAEHPAGLDSRREAILDAIWNNDESAFNELAKSPLTGEGGLLNQKFSKITREFRKVDRWPLRTMRSHPVKQKTATAGDSVFSFHQWMTLPRTSQKPRRGNINLIFNSEDWSLSFVRVNHFDHDRINLLPYPDSAIENDPVVDRPVPEDE